MKFGFMLMSLFLVFAACERGTTRTSAASENGVEKERDRYIDTIKAKLDEMDKKIDGLEERKAAMKGNAKKQFDRDIERLRDQRSMVEQKLDDLKGVSDASWTNMKAAVDQAMADLEKSYEKVSATRNVR